MGGFVNSEEVLVYLRDNDPAYMDVSSVGELVERLGIKLDEPVENPQRGASDGTAVVPEA